MYRPLLIRTTRQFASLTSSQTLPYQIFDRAAKKTQKNNAASRQEASVLVDYLRNEIAERMMERLDDIKRKFDCMLDLGSGPGHFTKLLERDKVKRCLMIESSEKLLNRDPDSEFEVDIKRVQGDEENLLQIVEPGSQDAIVSCLSLHWMNDLPGLLVQINKALTPDGLFLGAMIGGESLFELRTSLQLAEVERQGGISPHISPMTDIRDVSNLLSRAGFTLLTVDIDEVKIAYPTMWELVDDLRDMGESNAILERRHIIRRDILTAASAIYSALHGNEDGTIPATFQIIFMIGWKPAPSQPKPLDRGTAQTSLRDVL